MKLFFDSRRKSLKTLEKTYPGAMYVDVTSRGEMPWQKFSPFYPHGEIPIPFTNGQVAASVEGIWQGLKVFEKADVDPTKFEVRDMKGIKRSVRKYGQVLGHREGIEGERLLGYLEARMKIYLPSYYFVLQKYLPEALEDLKRMAVKQTVVLLDYETNGNIQDLSKPLSHASLIVAFLEGLWPTNQS